VPLSYLLVFRADPMPAVPSVYRALRGVFKKEKSGKKTRPQGVLQWKNFDVLCWGDRAFFRRGGAKKGFENDTAVCIGLARRGWRGGSGRNSQGRDDGTGQGKTRLFVGEHESAAVLAIVTVERQAEADPQSLQPWMLNTGRVHPIGRPWLLQCP